MMSCALSDCVSGCAQDCLSMVNIGGDLEGLPPGAEVIEAPRVQRQVE